MNPKRLIPLFAAALFLVASVSSAQPKKESDSSLAPFLKSSGEPAKSVAAAPAENYMWVNVPYADLREVPEKFAGGDKDDKLQTQVLYGEKVKVLWISGKFAYVLVPDQQTLDYVMKPDGKTATTKDKIWTGYPGYISYADLTDKVIPSDCGPGDIHCVRQDFVKRAKELVGTKYYWGGRSKDCGVDCSGLAHLSLTLTGRPDLLPRDSSKMHAKSRPVDPKNLKEGDLIFFGKPDATPPEKPKVHHVMIYAGDGQVLESPETGKSVRLISFEERTGHKLTEMKQGMKDDKRFYYFGRFLPDE